MWIKKIVAATASGALMIATALAQVPPPPQVSIINQNDLFQDIVGGQPQATNYYAAGSTFLAFIRGTASAVYPGVVAGDAYQNLWQAGTAGTSTTSSTPTWKNSADHWGQWATASAGVKIAEDTTAGDLPTAYAAMYALTHTNTTAGVLCMGQPLESANSYQFAGQTAELDFHLTTGAGWSSTAATGLRAFIVYGTGTDEGLAKMAYTINTAAGTSPGWAGGVVATVAGTGQVGVSFTGRYSAIVSIPSTATEIGVAFCYTAGTTDTNDYAAVTGIQLVRAPQLASFASATVAYLDTATPPSFQAAAFIRTETLVEALRQYRYYYRVNEFDTAGVVQYGGGSYVDTTHCQIAIPLPAPMFKTPLIDNAAITATTFLVAPGSVATPVVLAGTGNSGLILAVGTAPALPFTVATASFITTAETAHNSCALTSTAAGGGSFGFLAED